MGGGCETRVGLGSRAWGPRDARDSSYHLRLQHAARVRSGAGGSFTKAQRRRGLHPGPSPLLASPAMPPPSHHPPPQVIKGTVGGSGQNHHTLCRERLGGERGLRGRVGTAAGSGLVHLQSSLVEGGGWLGPRVSVGQDSHKAGGRAASAVAWVAPQRVVAGQVAECGRPSPQTTRTPALCPARARNPPVGPASSASSPPAYIRHTQTTSSATSQSRGVRGDRSLLTRSFTDAGAGLQRVCTRTVLRLRGGRAAAAVFHCRGAVCSQARTTIEGAVSRSKREVAGIRAQAQGACRAPKLVWVKGDSRSNKADRRAARSAVARVDAWVAAKLAVAPQLVVIS